MHGTAPGALTSADMPPEPDRASRMLIAFGGERAPVRALCDAFHFARAVGAQPHVVRVVSPGLASELAPRHMAERARHEAKRLIAAARHARVLCDGALGERLSVQQLTARLGSFIEQVALRAAEIGADLIAVSPNRKRLAETVQRLAVGTKCAILVPRRAACFNRLLAATDLAEPSTPLLRCAAQLGRNLDATVVALHGVPAAGGPRGPSLEQRLVMLEHATRRLGGHFESVVLRTGDPAREILEQALQRNADVILVGTRRDAAGTATEVLRGAQRSVVVAPLGDASRGRPEPWVAAQR